MAGDYSDFDQVYLIGVSGYPSFQNWTDTGGSAILSLNSAILSLNYGADYVDANITSVTVTAVPEASTWAMMLAGFAGLGYAAYRKTKTERMAFA